MDDRLTSNKPISSIILTFNCKKKKTSKFSKIKRPNVRLYKFNEKVHNTSVDSDNYFILFSMVLGNKLNLLRDRIIDNRNRRAASTLMRDASSEKGSKSIAK